MVNYIADGVCSDTNEALLNGVPVIKKVLTSALHAILNLDRAIKWKASSFLLFLIQNGENLLNNNILKKLL